ncbi:hypothetical protein GCM10022240_27300 [Microbacterium kribbense]|uniref:HTH tetR-type domain-containing protein n=1 Tax=Microbacterium kribbense TaxID=433645 RepID=A0ABP7GT75_9MICO
MQDLPTPGLRERKREQTRHRLESAAIEIALEEGLDHLTIDALSERADVSPRTFFNYFDSKEDAILGMRTQDDTEQLVSEALEQMHPDTVLEGVLELLTTVGRGPDHDLHEQRHRVLREHPELLQRKFTHMGRMLAPLTEGVRTLMTRLSAEHADDAPSAAHAQVMLMTCGAALRAATAELARGHRDLSTEASTILLRARAAALVRETAGILK